MDLSVQGKCSWCEIYGHMVEDLQNNQTSGWSGTDDKTKDKPGTGKGKGKQDKGKGKGKSKNKGKDQKHCKKGMEERFHEMEGHEDKQETQNLSIIHRVDCHELGSR